MSVVHIDPEELERKAQELYERSQQRSVVKVIQEIDGETGTVLKTKIIKPTVYKSPQTAKNALAQLRPRKAKERETAPNGKEPDNVVIQSVAAIMDYENSDVFTEDEKRYLTQRKNEYEEYYTLDTPFDRNLLNYVLLEELNLYRLYALLPADSDKGEVSEKISKAVKRLTTFAGDLKIKTQKDRESEKLSGFSQLVREFDKKDGKMLDDDTAERWEREEKELLNRHRRYTDDSEEEMSDDGENESEA